ncbi:uncharacterized protein BDR25DRAFT_357520 [Lindgomyces ingoldianus]|uniref:Uncharacterized protein n=1 Tax=Lindgomyces ingoldianus TaxID=673940 RepID=A0ACB6QQZ8_9PLEO|nr:uncharacterized protein BDR25DRAFT_357520 [Lindgomyces ingoldianus]KAF2468591.1 hypothetical protein BDR25DRAFT_357520 [Lindgomyces ingoldianus]
MKTCLETFANLIFWKQIRGENSAEKLVTLELWDRKLTMQLPEAFGRRRSSMRQFIEINIVGSVYVHIPATKQLFHGLRKYEIGEVRYLGSMPREDSHQNALWSSGSLNPIKQTCANKTKFGAEMIRKFLMPSCSMYNFALRLKSQDVGVLPDMTQPLRQNSAQLAEVTVIVLVEMIPSAPSFRRRLVFKCLICCFVTRTFLVVARFSPQYLAFEHGFLDQYLVWELAWVLAQSLTFILAFSFQVNSAALFGPYLIHSSGCN